MGLMGCSHAWVVSKDDGGGVIGYTDTTPSKDVPREVKTLIPCTDFALVSDNVKTENYQFFSTQNRAIKNSGALAKSVDQTQNFGNSFDNKSMPTAEARSKSWREVSYTCNSNSAEANRRPTAISTGNSEGDSSYQKQFPFLFRGAVKY